MGVDIDKLNIEVVSTNAGNVAKEIDKISKTMEKLKQSVKNTGLPRLCNQLKKLKETAQELSGLNAYTEKVAKFSESIHKLSGLKIPSVSKMTARVKELVDMSKEMSSFTGADELAEKVNQICSAMKPMESMGKNTLAPFINSMKKIPELTKQMNTETLQDLKNMIKEITSAIQPLITQVSKSEKGLVSLNRIIQSTVSSNGNLSASNAAAVKSYTSVSSILTSTKAKLLAYSYAVIRVTRVLKDWLDLSNDFIENLNLFEVAMGKGAKEALNYAESINKALGIDVSDWIRNQGVFKQVTSGFGVLNDTSDTMSKNLTQLGYDISSFFNIDVDEAMQKLQSGISGEIEPLRRLGYAIDTATLQQVAYSKGITLNINKMTQAQKAQLRYIAILQQSQNVMGDMARTVTTPANAMRILDQQMTQLKRSIGNIISILVQKLLPYIQAFVRLLGDAADYLAKLWGFELPTIDYSNVGNGLSTISDEADNATESVKQTAKQMQMLAGFDELNILGDSKSNSDDFSVSSANPDLGIQMPEYDFLSGLDNQSDSVYKNMKEKALELIRKFKSLADWIKENKMLVGILAGAFATLYAAKKIKDFFKKLGGLSILKTAKTWLKNFIDGFKATKATNFFKKLNGGVKTFREKLSPVARLLGTVAGTAMSSLGSYNLFKNLAKDTADWKTVLGDSALIVGGLGMSWIFGGAPGLAIATLGTAIGGLFGHAKGLHEKILAINKAAIESKLFNNGGIAIDELTDAFEEQFKKLSELNGKLKDYDEKIGDNKTDIEEYKKTVEEYKKKIDGTGTLAEQELGPMKEAVEDLAGALKESMELDCSKFFEIVKKSISGIAKDVGIDVKEMTEAITNFQKLVSGKIGESEKAINNYMDKWGLSGKPIYKEGEDVKAYKKKLSEYNKDRKEYEDAMDYLNGMASEITQAKSNFQDALSEASKVDFKSESATKEALADLKKYTDEAKKDAKEIYQSSLNTYDNLIQELNYNHNVGLIKDKEYSELKKQLVDFKKGAKAAYNKNRKEIDDSVKDVIQKIYDSANKSTFQNLKEKNPNLENMSKEWAKGKLKDLREDLSYVYTGIEDIVDSNNIKLSDKLEKDFLDSFKDGNLSAEVENYLANEFFDYNTLMETEIDPKLKESGKKSGKAIGNGIKDADPYLSKQLEGMKSNVGSLSTSIKDFNFYLNGKNDVSGEFAKGILDGSNSVKQSIDDMLTGLALKIEQKSPELREKIHQLLSIAGSSSSPVVQIGVMAGMTGLNAIHGYASGGFPTSGQLFCARENGMPEMVGKIGNQTAVANNGQIEKGIENAVYKAMTSANGSGFSSNNQPVNITVPVYIDGQKMDEQQYNYRQRQLVRSNGRREY